MDIGHFFEFQCAFQRDWKVDAATEEQEVPLLVIPFGNRDDLRLTAEHPLNQHRKSNQTIEPGLAVRDRQGSAHAAQMQRQHVERRELRGEGLGRGYADLRSTMRVEDAIGFAG